MFAERAWWSELKGERGDKYPQRLQVVERNSYTACKTGRVQCACTGEELITPTRKGYQSWVWFCWALLPGECLVLQYLIFTWPCLSPLSSESPLISERSCSSNSFLQHPHGLACRSPNVLYHTSGYRLFKCVSFCFHNLTILLASTTWHSLALWTWYGLNFEEIILNPWLVEYL